MYDLVVLDPNEDEHKKCSVKLLDGVLILLGKQNNGENDMVFEFIFNFFYNTDALMVFQQTAVDDWSEMTRLCLGLLLKCSHHPNADIVAMATAKLHGILQNRTMPEPQELGFLMFSINTALNKAIDGKLF